MRLVLFGLLIVPALVFGSENIAPGTARRAPTDGARPAVSQDDPPTPAPFDVAALEAQSQGSFNVGGGVEGELSADEPEHWWALPLAYGDVIFIAVNAAPGSGLVPEVSVVAPDGGVVAWDDNPAQEQNALIRNLAALQEGVYYIRVGSVTGAAGAYNVIAGRLAATPTGQTPPTPTAPRPEAAPASTATPTVPAALPTPTPFVGQQGALQLGQTVEANLPAGERHFYTFEAAGGMPVQVDLLALDSSPTTLDPYLELYGPAGYFLARNDDRDYDTLNSRLEVTLPTTGVYTLVVYSVGDLAGGPYSLSLQIGALWD